MRCICKKIATNQCAKCTIKYCSRECQVNDWKKHKLICGETPKALTCMKINEKLHLNYLVTHAYNESLGILIEFNESIEDYITSDVHFAHISAQDIKDEHRIDKTINNTAHSFKVAIKFSNYQLIIKAQNELDLATIRSKHVRPDTVWSILM